MIFSLSTVMNTLVFSSILIVLSVLLTQACSRSIHIKLRMVCFLCIVTMLRLLFPFEFPFTHSIRIKNLWGQLHSVLYTEYLHMDTLNLSFIHILLILWGACSFYKLGASLYRYGKMKDSIMNLPKTTDPCALQALTDCNTRFRSPVPIRLVTDRLICSPCIIGIHKPVILIPDIHLTAEEWGCIFTHELIHLYHGHLLLYLLLELLSDLYFWNPLLNIFKKAFYQLLEFSADEKATSMLDDSESFTYADCLIKMVHFSQRKAAPTIYSVSFGSSGLPGRIQRIVNTEHRSEAKHSDRFFLTGTVMLFLLSYGFILEPHYEPADDTVFLMDSSNSCYHVNEHGTYDVFYKSNYVTTVEEIFDDQIPVTED